MKPTKVIYIVALVCAAVSAGFWLRHHQGGSATDHPLSVVSPSPSTPATLWESKTVEKEVPADQAQQVADQRQQMEEFSREGWLVLSISGPVRQADGTLHRTVKLKRAKQ